MLSGKLQWSRSHRHGQPETGKSRSQAGQDGPFSTQVSAHHQRANLENERRRDLSRTDGHLVLSGRWSETGDSHVPQARHRPLSAHRQSI